MKKIITIRDYFKNFKLDKSKHLKDADPAIRPYYEEATCKLCGLHIKELSPLGAYGYFSYSSPKLFGDELLQEHLEEHIRITRLIERLGPPPKDK